MDLVMNSILAVFVVLALIMHYNNRKKKGIKGFNTIDIAFFVPMFVFGILYFYALYTQEGKKDMIIEAFNNEQEILCKDDSKLTYQVSAKDGWSVEGKNLIKDEVSLSSSKCRLN